MDSAHTQRQNNQSNLNLNVEMIDDDLNRNCYE
jgi:hypothetical protein